MDREKFKEFELQAWHKKSAAYNSFFDQLTPQTLPDIISNLPPKIERPILDLASGPGYIAAGLDLKGFDVIGVDFSEVMVEIARKKYPEIKFQQGDAEHLSFPDNHFDAVVINFGVVHFADPLSCFREVHRILAKGGKLLFSVWKPAEHSLGMKIIYSAISQYADLTVIPEGPDFFRYADFEIAKQDLSNCGYHNIKCLDMDTCWNLKEPEAFYRAYLEGGARLGSMMDLQTKQVRACIIESIKEQLEELRTEAGYKIPVPSILLLAEKD